MVLLLESCFSLPWWRGSSSLTAKLTSLRRSQRGPLLSIVAAARGAVEARPATGRHCLTKSYTDIMALKSYILGTVNTVEQ